MRLKKLIARNIRKLEKNILVEEYKGQGIKTDFLIATKNGLYHLYNERLYKLINGEFYGLSRHDGNWYVFQKQEHRGRILEFRLKDGLITNKRKVIGQLSGGCHQIDFIDDRLFITDTYNNRLVSYVNHAGKFRLDSENYPDGKLVNGRSSGNYAHMNSMIRTAEGIFLLFHNETTKTGRNSEIIRLGKNFEIADRQNTRTGNAHNLIIRKGKFLICDSAGSTLCIGNIIAFRANMFTRGLASNDEYIILGGSAYGERAARNHLHGNIYILDTDYNKLFEFPVPGMVQEIRISNGKDYGLCNCSVGL
jgi:hypothetical protein